MHKGMETIGLSDESLRIINLKPFVGTLDQIKNNEIGPELSEVLASQLETNWRNGFNQEKNHLSRKFMHRAHDKLARKLRGIVIPELDDDSWSEYGMGSQLHEEDIHKYKLKFKREPSWDWDDYIDQESLL